MTSQIPPTPRQAAPSLSLPLVGGGTWSLAESAPENFTLLVFYRGWHCPACRNQLHDIRDLLPEFAKRGVKVMAISTDGADRAGQTVEKWELGDLPVAYDLTLEQAREWGLYVSTSRGLTSIGIEEPVRFNEPGLFLIKPDGTVYFAAIQSAPFARPKTQDLLNAVDFVLANDYPARGEVTDI